MNDKIEVILNYCQDRVLEIVERAATQFVERLSHGRQEFDKLMTKAIENKVNEILADVVTRVFQPVDVFGSPVGGHHGKERSGKEGGNVPDRKGGGDEHTGNSYARRCLATSMW